MVKRNPAMAPRRLPAGERREALLAAALPVFAIRGYEGTTTRDLAAAAQVSEPVLYRHFPSKADLFAAVLSRVEERLLARLEGAIAEAGDAPRRIEALAKSLPDLLARMEDEFRVLNGAAATHGDARTAALVRGTYAKLGAFLSRALSTAGLRRGLSPEVAGHVLLEIGLGASLARTVRVPAMSRNGYGDAALALLLSAMTRPNRT